MKYPCSQTVLLSTVLMQTTASAHGPQHTILGVEARIINTSCWCANVGALTCVCECDGHRWTPGIALHLVFETRLH